MSQLTFYGLHLSTIFIKDFHDSLVCPKSHEVDEVNIFGNA